MGGACRLPPGRVHRLGRHKYGSIVDAGQQRRPDHVPQVAHVRLEERRGAELVEGLHHPGRIVERDVPQLQVRARGDIGARVTSRHG